MQHSPVAVGCFQGGGEAVLIGEGHAQRPQTLDVGCLLQQSNGVAVAKARSSQNGVFRMTFSAVLLLVTADAAWASGWSAAVCG